MDSRATTWDERAIDGLWGMGGLLFRPLQMALAFPSLIYLAAMAVFLFRPPDVDLYYADRVAFVVLIFFVGLRTLALREPMPWVRGISLPMLGLILLAAIRALREPFDPQTWSLVAARFVVPFVLFHVAILVFREPAARERFETFALVVLAYLVFTAIAFLAGAKTLIFPAFILDGSLGHHVDRARGPFLQAVANGVALNLLGLMALVFAGYRHKVALLLWLALPVAILATMTRAVWISFALSTFVAAFLLGRRYFQQICISIAAVGLLAGIVVGLSGSSLQSAISDRTEERGPVDVRMAVYEAGWAMFLERPMTGWTASGMYAELARRMDGYHLRSFYVHSTYLSLLVEFGIPGLLLYLIPFFNLFRIARGGGEFQANLRKIWPVLLGVFLFNALFVDMVYQFVNGLLFTIAGMLCATEDAA